MTWILLILIYTRRLFHFTLLFSSPSFFFWVYFVIFLVISIFILFFLSLFISLTCVPFLSVLFLLSVHVFIFNFCHVLNIYIFVVVVFPFLNWKHFYRIFIFKMNNIVNKNKIKIEFWQLFLTYHPCIRLQSFTFIRYIYVYFIFVFKWTDQWKTKIWQVLFVCISSEDTYVESG